MSDSQQFSDPAVVAPVAEKRPTTRTHHGDVVTDPYEWLRDKESPEVLAHLEAENAYAAAQTDDLADLRERIVGEIKARTQETDLSVPVAEGPWWYYSRTVEGQQYAIRARAPRVPGDDVPPELVPGEPVEGEQVLLDENVAAEGHEFFSLGSFDLSGDGDRLAYATDVVGDERYTLRVRDLTTGEDLADEVPGTFPGATFSPDGRYVFYPTVDDAWRPHRIWRHEVGTPAGDDVIVFEEPDDRYWVGVGLSRSRRYLQIELGSKITSESWILESDDPTGDFRVVWPRREGVEYTVEHAVLPGADGPRDSLLITHNDGALDFEVVATDVPTAGATLLPEDATVVVPHDPSVRIEGVDAFAGHVVVSYRKDALARVGVVRLDVGRAEVVGRAEDGGRARRDQDLDRLDQRGRLDQQGPLDQPWQIEEIAFDEPLYTVGVGANPAWDQRHVRIGQTSFVTPATVYDHDVATGERTLRKRQPVLGGYDPADYAQSREWATADDGTQIPISLVWRRDAVTLNASGMQADPAPLMLYGYGSYEISTDPGFSVPRLSLLDRGVVFAVAHVRGGGEMGRGWYDDGKTLTKKNSFTDFVTCARHLVGSGWTTPERTVAYGGSAGGLLMGAVANLAPQDFAGVVAAVPFVDPLTSILDPSLPLTVIEWDEWGNPLEDPEVYAYMKEYSPYENVRDDVEYPRILALTSLNDTRVLYVEPAKWVARLREVGADVVLKIEMSAGHGGVSGRYERWKEIAFEDAWTLDVLGLAGRA
ncbi:oligopeptidase B Serine peptidase. MEROPS family S09A [Paraoerskovia marina]|uniref:Oligopeptidase B Serine peptidase. MEROPS family S09A n=1 Tax=Paraoerskovia marina TaxID=545619 RepID=A0A1H1NPI3_9CELL|nr:S9 family peptidase [Paraoerskovia marina]SDS00823.1 oligopeptidase B Serine peptidase. MEROPS family S09A [Paraoerskovia marina]